MVYIQKLIRLESFRDDESLKINKQINIPNLNFIYLFKINKNFLSQNI